MNKDVLDRAFADLRDGTEPAAERLDRVRNRLAASVDEGASTEGAARPRSETPRAPRTSRWPYLVMATSAAAALAIAAMFLGEPAPPPSAPIAQDDVPGPHEKVIPKVVPSPQIDHPPQKKRVPRSRAARIAGLRVQGAVREASAQAKLRPRRIRLARCLTDEKLSTARVHVVCDRFGRVKDVQLGAQTAPREEFEACIRGSISGLRFDVDRGTTAAARPADAESIITFDLRTAKP